MPGIDIRRFAQVLGADLADDQDRYSTLAGYLLHRFGHVPKPGETIDQDGLSFEVVSTDARRIGTVRVVRRAEAEVEPSR